MEKITEVMFNWTLIQASVWITVLNVFILFSGLLLGKFLIWVAGNRRVAPKPPKITIKELIFTCFTVLGNSFITVVGWFLWTKGYIHIGHEYNIWIIIDFLVLFLWMDLFMYLLHRVAHHDFFYKYLHLFHHEYPYPRPISLFVLSPLENLSFGSLWLVLIYLYSSCWIAVILFLSVNLFFGIVGHLGVEPFPDSGKKYFLSTRIGTSTFHAFHHQDEKYNFGFYTTIWDHLFSTLAPYYEEKFGKLPK